MACLTKTQLGNEIYLNLQGSITRLPGQSFEAYYNDLPTGSPCGLSLIKIWGFTTPQDVPTSGSLTKTLNYGSGNITLTVTFGTPPPSASTAPVPLPTPPLTTTAPPKVEAATYTKTGRHIGFLKGDPLTNYTPYIEPQPSSTLPSPIGGHLAAYTLAALAFGTVLHYGLKK